MVSGDRNSKYFHNRASQHFQRIKSLNLDGVLVSGDDSVATMVVDYYSKLFTTSDPCNIGCVVHKVGCIR